MRYTYIILLFLPFTSISQESLSELANEHYRTYDFHTSFDYLMQMDSVELSEPWNTYLLANAYFACGYMSLSEQTMKKVLCDGFTKIFGRFLIRTYIEKYDYENNHKLKQYWQTLHDSLNMHKMRSCMSTHRLRKYYLLIQHYDAIGDIKSKDHFKRVLKRRKRKMFP